MVLLGFSLFRQKRLNKLLTPWTGKKEQKYDPNSIYEKVSLCEKKCGFLGFGYWYLFFTSLWYMSFKDVSSDENSHPPAFCLVNYVVVFRDGESKIIPLYHSGWLGHHVSSDYSSPVGCVVEGMKYYQVIIGIINKQHGSLCNQPVLHDSCSRLCGFLITAPTMELWRWAHHIGLRWEWLTDDVLRLDVAEHCPGFSSDPKFPEISMSTSEAILEANGGRILSFLGAIWSYLPY